MRQSSPFIALVATVMASVSSSAVCAFTTNPQQHIIISSNTQKHQRRGDRYTLFAEEGEGDTSKQSPLLATKILEEGSHDELMYALGVNLARQLGDVRPLVENSEELTQLARGLLDTVVGKIDDEDQRSLLGRRGDDLNKIIVERA